MPRASNGNSVCRIMRNRLHSGAKAGIAFWKGFTAMDMHESTLVSEEPESVPGVAHHLIEGVYAIALVMTVGAWSVLGFAVWIPLLVRSTILLVRAVFRASLFRDEARVTNAQLFVHFAVGFYVNGFRHFRGFYRHRTEPTPPMGLFEPLSAMTSKELVVECAWAVGVWMVILFLLRAATTALL